MASRRTFTREQRTPIVHGMLAFVLILVMMQLWLLTATMNAYLGGDDTIVGPAALASLLCFALCAGLLRYLRRLESFVAAAANGILDFMQLVHSLIVLGFASALTIVAPVPAQRRPAGSAPQEAKVSATIALNVAGMAYQFSGQAVCEHLSRGSIYDIPAERWSVRHSEAARDMSLTVWRPQSGGDMVTLAVSIGGKRHDVDTVKAPKATAVTGSATVKLAPEGKGGTFTLNATAGSGAAVTGTIKCEAFTTPAVVAGN